MICNKVPNICFYLSKQCIPCCLFWCGYWYSQHERHCEFREALDCANAMSLLFFLGAVIVTANMDDIASLEKH